MTTDRSLLVPGTMRYLTVASDLEQGYGPRLARATIVLLVASVVLFLLWAALTNIDELITAKGEVIPHGHVQVVQHLDGGMVKEIMVREGDRVQPGQVVMVLDGGGSEKDLAELNARITNLKLEAERLRAFLEHRELDFARLEGVSPAQQAEQKRIFGDMLTARRHEETVLRNQLAQRKEVLSSLEIKRNSIAQNLRLSGERRDIQQQLVEKGMGSRIRLLERQEGVNTTTAELAHVRGEALRTRQEIAEYESRLASLTAQQRDEANQELDRIAGEIAADNEKLSKHQNRVGRLDIKSPVGGYVKGLAVNTVGEVVPAGGKLMEIVPLDKELVVEARILPRDIGNLSVGQSVRVRVQSFDFTRYGTVDGRLEKISATTFADEERQSYYRGEIRLAKPFVGDDPAYNRVLPGMTVDAYIVTGEKTVLGYLLKPIQRAMKTAMTEQ